MLDKWICKGLGLAENADREEMDAGVLKALSDIVEYAKAHSSFYRERLGDGRVSSIEEFRRLPLMSSDDIREQGVRMVCVSADEIERINTITTSGSTGVPKRIYSTAKDQELTIDYFANGMNEFIVPGTRSLSLFPGTSPGSLNALLAESHRRIGSEMLVFGYPKPEEFSAVYDTIINDCINSLVGSAACIGLLARYSEEIGRAEEIAAQMDHVLLAAAFVPENERQDIMRIWKCRVDEHYGMTESGLCGAVGCIVPGGYHIWESGVYYEIIDPVTGEVVPDGEYGEVVVTTISREAMPVIRYRTGDYSRLIPGTCECGSRVKRLERVKARPQEKKFSTRDVSDLTLG